MKRGSKKPYEKKKRTISFSIPNQLIDFVENDMKKRGEENLSAKLTSIISQWAEGCFEDKKEQDGCTKHDQENHDKELARFKGFSSSKFV